MRGKWLLFSGVTILLAVAAGALWVYWRGNGRPAPRPQPPQQPAVFPGSEITLPGKIRAQKTVLVAAPIDGTIESLLVEPGREVYEGELLGRIRNTGLEGVQELAAAEAERAQTRLANLEAGFLAARLEASRAHADASRSQTEFQRAERAYLRQQMLYKEGATPRLVYEKAQKEFELAQGEFRNLEELERQTQERADSLRKEIDNARRLLAEKNQALEEAGQNLAAGEILSPADGILVAAAKQVGDEVTPETKDLFQIATELSSLEAVLEPEPPVLARVRPGQPALVQVAEILDEGLPGTVKEIKDTEVIVEFVSPSPAIRPGLTAQVRIKLE